MYGREGHVMTQAGGLLLPPRVDRKPLGDQIPISRDGGSEVPTHSNNETTNVSPSPNHT